MLTPLHDDRRYVCPGEPGEIHRSLHLARLAAGYVKCRACPHRDDYGVLRPLASPGPTGRISEPAPEGSLLRTSGGFRGVAVNQLNRHRAISWAAALASILWDEIGGWRPGAGVSWKEGPSLPADVPPPGDTPTIIIGYDERPSAPDVMLGLTMGLQRMSCRVVEIGLTTGPCLQFAINHLRAEAGVFVTGSGCDPAWTGFDVYRSYGLPADTAFLDRWQELQQHPVSRPSRSGGRVTPFAAGDQYEASLRNRFHALRPLKVVCGATSPILLARLDQLFARLPGRLEIVRLPWRRRDLQDPNDDDAQRIGASVREHTAHLGFVIDDDAMACSVIDEQGRLINVSHLQARLIEHLLREQEGGTVILSTDVWDDLAPVVTTHGGRPVLVADADRAPRLMVEQALIAMGSDHRLWFGGAVPACDAIISLAAVMQLLSRSDREASRVMGST